MSELQNALLPAGPQAAHIHLLWQVMLVVCTIVFFAVLAALFLALARGRREPSASRASESTTHRWIGVGIASSVLLLAFLFGVTLYTDRALASRVEGHAEQECEQQHRRCDADTDPSMRRRF